MRIVRRAASVNAHKGVDFEARAMEVVQLIYPGLLHALPVRGVDKKKGIRRLYGVGATIVSKLKIISSEKNREWKDASYDSLHKWLVKRRTILDISGYLHHRSFEANRNRSAS